VCYDFVYAFCPKNLSEIRSRMYIGKLYVNVDVYQHVSGIFMPIIRRSYCVWNLLNLTLLAARTYRRLVDVWKNCGPLVLLILYLGLASYCSITTR